MEDLFAALWIYCQRLISDQKQQCLRALDVPGEGGIKRTNLNKIPSTSQAFSFLLLVHQLSWSPEFSEIEKQLPSLYQHVYYLRQNNTIISIYKVASENAYLPID